MNVKTFLTVVCVLFGLFSVNSAGLTDDSNLFQNNGSSLNNAYSTTEQKESDLSRKNISNYSEFPPGIFSKDQLKHGAIILYFFGAIYSFGIIGMVCGDFFLPSVDCICTDLNLSQDIAAATFMSFATTAPELFIILIATFITKSDIGVGAVVGSGMFNILGVATIGGLAARAPIKLDWWPLYRDSLVYMFAPVALSVIVSDGFVTLPEAICLISYYFFYFIIMFFSRRIRNQIKIWIKKFKAKKIKNDESPAIKAEKPVPIVPTISLTLDDTKGADVHNNAEPMKEDGEDYDDGSFKAFFVNYEDSISLRRISTCSSSSCRSRRKSDRSLRKSSVQTIGSNTIQGQMEENPNVGISNKKEEDINIVEAQKDVNQLNEDEIVRVSLFRIPDGTFWNKFTWMIMWPSSFALYYTIPDCRFERWRRFYPITFLMCVFWIAVSSYFGTWMISIMGETIGISHSVMGLTFLALGGSMPEAISTFIMSRQGEGGLGFSNSLGGNTMDICLCLGLPWLVKCLMEGKVPIESEGIQYNSAALVIGIIVLLSTVTHTKFHMNKKLGFVCCVFYFIFIVISVLIEMNVIEVDIDR